MLQNLKPSTSKPLTLNAPDPDNAGVGNGLWSLTKVGSTPTAGRFN